MAGPAGPPVTTGAAANDVRAARAGEPVSAGASHDRRGAAGAAGADQRDGAVSPHEAEEGAEGDLADASRSESSRRSISSARSPSTYSVTSTRRVERSVRTRGAARASGRGTAAPGGAGAGLELVVQLVGDPLPYLAQHRTGVESRPKALDERGDEAEVARVALDRLRHARMLHLERDVVSVLVRAGGPGRARRGRTAARRSRRTAPGRGRRGPARSRVARGRRGPPGRRRAAHRARGATARLRWRGRAGPSRGTA
jgi:hypothetical protein